MNGSCTYCGNPAPRVYEIESRAERICVACLDIVVSHAPTTAQQPTAVDELHAGHEVHDAACPRCVQQWRARL